MLNEFVFKLPVKSEWIDYNKHMQDAYYGLALAMQSTTFRIVLDLMKGTEPNLDAQYTS